MLKFLKDCFALFHNFYAPKWEDVCLENPDQISLICVAIAGIWGAITAKPRALFVQTVPALLALALFYCS